MASFLDLNTKRGAHINERLLNDKVVWLNTVRPDGRPHSVVVWFLWEGESILIFSRPNNQKVHNLRQNPNIVLALDNTHGGADPITIEGVATLLSPADLNTTLPEYVTKYAADMARINMTPLTMANEYSQPIRITPSRAM